MRARHGLLAATAATAAALALLSTGCGSGARPHHPAAAARAAARAAVAPHTRTVPTPAPTGVAPSATAVSVIKGWSSALRQGHLDAAAAYFAFPSAFVNGGGGGVVTVVTIRNPAQARVVNASLPCGATFLSADQRGRYINALFRLGGRSGPGGGSCGSGAGLTARTNFLISGGKILEWIRAPDDPGDNGNSTGTSPEPTPAPSNPPAPGGNPVA